jgi:hypothetical protein
LEFWNFLTLDAVGFPYTFGIILNLENAVPDTPIRELKDTKQKQKQKQKNKKKQKKNKKKGFQR